MKSMTSALGDVRAFVEVAHVGGFRLAATNLGIAQPTLTLRIQRLEAAVGTKLFDRTTRRVVLSSSGKALLAQCARPMEDIDAALRELRDASKLKHGRVAIGASPTIAGTLLPPLIQRFLKMHPGAQVELVDELAGPLLEKLSTGALDFAIAPAPEKGTSFRAESLYSERMVFVAPRSANLPANRALRFEEIADQPFVSMPRPSIIWRTLARAFASVGREFRPVFEANNASTLLGLVGAGMGLSLMPATLVEQSRMHSVVTVSVGDVGYERRICLITVRGRSLGTVPAALASLVRSTLAHSAARR